MAPQSDCPMESADGVSADASLLAQGWTRRFLAAPERVDEMFELYRSMGLEVRAEKPLPVDFGARCAGCAESGCHDFFMIYTRPAKSRP